MSTDLIIEIAKVNLKLRTYFEEQGYKSYLQKTVPSDYYDQTLQARCDMLQAPSVDYLCKSILMENTAYDEKYQSVYYPRYLCIIIQYVTKINAEKILKWARSLQANDHQNKAPKSKFHFRLLPEEISSEISGYQYNAVTPFCMTQSMPVLVSQGLRELGGQFFWIGGGHIDIKLRIGLKEFVERYDDYVYFGDIVYE